VTSSDDRKRRGEASRRIGRPVSPLYLCRPRVIYFYGVSRPLRAASPSPRARARCSSSGRWRRRGTKRGTSSDSRTRGRRRRYTRLPRLLLRRYPPLSEGEKPRARLMALRGCHGYREPRGTDATAAPSGKPIYPGKTL